MSQPLTKERMAEALELLEKFESFGTTPMKEAEMLIFGDREKTYGDPSKNLARIAEMWNAYLMKNVREVIGAAFVEMGRDRPSDETLRRLTHPYSSGVNLNISVTDVCRMMQHLKQSRDENNPKRDNIVDDIGYAGLAHRCRTPAYERSIPTGVSSEIASGSVAECVGELPSKRKPPMKRKTIQSKSKRKAR